MLLGIYKTLTFGQKKIYPYATGGDYVYLYEDTATGKTYRVHEFLSTGTSTLEVEVGGQMDVFIVAGGGGGSGHRFGNPGGGGGAGGKILNTNVNVAAGSYSVTVGAGGLGSAGNSDTYGEDGATSAFSDWEATGGGAGGYSTSVGRNGGSGGGGSSRSSGGSGIVGQGYDGGDGYYINTAADTGGGGGGASEAGHDGFVGAVKDGTGGAGVEWPSGSGNVYAEGGDGGRRNEFDDGDDALPNTGSGGGGGDGSGGGTRNGGDGGSGIVIVRYVVAEKTLWTPSELTSLVSWHKADAITGLSDGDSVSTWSDSYGLYDVSAVTTERPLYKTGIQNSLPIVRFDGSDDRLKRSGAPITGTTARTFAIVAKADVVESSGLVGIGKEAISLSSGTCWDITPEVGVRVIGSKTFTSGFGTTNFRVLTVSVAASSNVSDVDAWLDGVGLVQNTLSDATIDTRSSDVEFIIGERAQNASPSNFNGDIGEIVIFNEELSTTDRQKLEGYLAHKWGLTDNLPSGHPYKYEPPYKVEPEEIVTDGLVLNLDAGDYASYPRSGTTWYDISGNGLTGALTNGPTYDSANKGSIVFDGSNDYVDVSSTTPTSLQGNPSFTVEGWFKKSGSWSSGSVWGLGGGTNLQGINSFNSSSTDEITIDLWGTSTYTTNIQYSSTEWKHIAWTYNGQGFTTSNIIIYINGVAYTGNDLEVLRGGSGTPNINNNGIVLGRAGRTINDYYGKPIIGNFRIYSKVLSSTEIAQNFNALRGRYGV